MSRLKWFVAAALPTVLALALPMQAQLPSVGARVRVRGPCPAGYTCDPIAGTLTAISGDSITVLPTGGVHQVMPLQAVTRFEVSRGRRGHARTGLAVGAIVGVVALVAFGDDCEDTYVTDCDAVAPLAPLAIAFYGGLGALVGHWIKTERWERVAVCETFIHPTSGGLQMGLRVAI